MFPDTEPNRRASVPMRTARLTAFAAAASIIARHSSSVTVSSFSHRTSIPASAARGLHTRDVVRQRDVHSINLTAAQAGIILLVGVERVRSWEPLLSSSYHGITRHAPPHRNTDRDAGATAIPVSPYTDRPDTGKQPYRRSQCEPLRLGNDL